MKKYFRYGVLIIMTLWLSHGHAQTITWADDIACITYTHCAGCHNNQNSLVAFPLTSYDEAYAQRGAMKYYTKYLSMPPYQPNTAHRRYAMEKNLSQQEIDLIAAWVDGGCVKGDMAHEPPSPVINPAHSTMMSPDVSIKMADYIIPNNGVNFRRCFILSAPVSAAKAIKEIEVVPGNLSAIYAVYVYADTSSVPLALDASDAGYGYTNFGGTGSNSAKPLYGWVHGQDPITFPQNFVLHIDSGSRYIIQVEYAEDAGGKLDSTRLNIKYASGAGNRMLYVNPLLHYADNLVNGPLTIPPDSVIEFHEQKTITGDLTLFSISPLMHHICTGFEVYAVQPGNDTIPVMEVDDHGEIWSEGTYFFQRPITLKNGSVLHAFAHYDNTSSNENNPNDPPKTINIGFGEDEEQMIVNFIYASYVAGDDTMILDSFPHQTHDQNCAPAHTVTSLPILLSAEKSIVIYPNPADASMTIQLNNMLLPAELSVINILGETVLKQSVHQKTTDINISGLPAGQYAVRIVSDTEILMGSLIKQ